jgi:predicted DNA-binding transcriptional regulator AlpA
MTTNNDRGTRLLSKREVCERLGVTYPTLWGWMRKGEFPRSVTFGGRTSWIESEVEAWVNNLPRSKLKGDAADAA